MSVNFVNYIIVSIFVFFIGLFGLYRSRNVIKILMSFELMLLSVNINFVIFSSFFGDLVGQIFSLFILSVAAAEVAVGLSIVVVFYRNRYTIMLSNINEMKG